MYKKLIVLWSMVLLCAQYGKADSRNFTVSLSMSESYADVEKVTEAHDTRVIDREWCGYFTDKQVAFGEKLASLTSMLSASDTYTEENEDLYEGQKNFNIFNAYLLAKYNLPKADYSKMDPYDAAVHLLFAMGTDDSPADTTRLRSILKRAPKSLALNCLMSAAIYYYTPYQRMPRAQVVLARKIAENMEQYTADIRLAGAQSLLDPVFMSDPCSQDNYMAESTVCKCSGDGNAKHSELAGCIAKTQKKILEELAEKLNTTEYALLRKWMLAEQEFITTQFYPTVGETEARQALNRQVLINQMVMHSSGISAVGYGLWNETELIKRYHPEKAATAEKYMNNEALGYEKNAACRAFFYKELDAILNELYKKLGGAQRTDLRDAQRAWLAWFEAMKKEKNIPTTDDGSGKDVFEQKLVQDVLFERVRMLSFYSCPASVIDKEEITGKEVYNVLK